MNIRKYKSEDFKIIKKWMHMYNLPDPQDYMWPEVRFVVEHNDKPLCAGFLYKTDSATAIIEGIVRDPLLGKNMAHESVLLLINALVDEAKKLGFKFVFTYTPHIKMLNKYLNCGFSIIHSKAVTLNRSL